MVWDDKLAGVVREREKARAERRALLVAELPRCGLDR